MQFYKMFTTTLLLSLTLANAFGPFGPHCNSQFTSTKCHGKNNKCTWCTSSDGDDNLCFSKKKALQLNSTSWTCTPNATTLATSVTIPEMPVLQNPEIPVPQNSFFSVYQKSNEHHCVELLCDQEISYQDKCFQIYWGLHGYQYDSYDQGMCPETFNYVNLKDVICNTSATSKNGTKGLYGCSIFTLGVQ